MGFSLTTLCCSSLHGLRLHGCRLLSQPIGSGWTNLSTIQRILARIALPCFCHSLLCITDLFFLLTFAFQLIAMRLHWYTSRRSDLSYLQLGRLHRFTPWMCLALSLLHFILSLLSLWTDQQNNGAPLLPIHQILFFVSRILSFLLVAVCLFSERRRGRVVYLRMIRLWLCSSLLLSGSGLYAAITQLKFININTTVLYDLTSLASIASSSLLFILASRSIYTPAGSTGGYSTAREPLLETYRVDEVNPDSVEASTSSSYSQASLLSKLTFTWLNPLFDVANKKPLEISDVPSLVSGDRADFNFKAFQEGWDRQLRFSHRSPSLPSVSRALWHSFRGPFLGSLVLGLVMVCVMYAGPILLNKLVTYAGSTGRKLTDGLVIVLLLFIAKLLETLTNHQFNFYSKRLGIKMQTALGSAVYHKTLRLSYKARRSRTVGEIINLMSTDVQRLLPLGWYLLQGLILPVQILIALVILFQEVGICMLSGLLLMIIIVGMSVFAAGKLRGYRVHALQAKDVRMKHTNEAFSNMKVIKMLAWEEQFREKIEGLRKVERGWVAYYMYTASVYILLLWFGPLAVSAVTFFTMALVGEELTAARVFTALTTFRILQEPLRATPDAISYVTQAVVSIERIRAFLCEEELDKGSMNKLEDESDISLNMDNATFKWELDMLQPAVQDINLQVKRGSCVAICGAVGSGKSSLLSCVLGELPKVAGLVTRSGRIAYVSQSPWIQNNTIKENILFGKPLEHKRYDEAVRVSGLVSDLELFPYGDETEIGERGINMSGGQKQRIQLARAVYTDADLYLLDDPFSAVDAHTGSHIFNECIKGALMHKTVILVTHQVEFLPAVDLIIVMRDGKIVQSGSYIELMQQGGEFNVFVKAMQRSLNLVHMSENSRTKGERCLAFPTSKIEDAENSHLTADTVDNEGMNRTGNNERNSNLNSPNEIKQLNGNRRLIQEEERERGHVSFRVYWMYLTKSYKGLLFPLILFFQMLTQILQVGSDAWLAWGTSHKDLMTSKRLTVTYGSLVLGCTFAILVRSFLVSFVGLATTQAFFIGMLRCIFHAPLTFFDSTPMGRILSRSSTDQSVLDMELPLIGASAINNAITVLGVIVVISTVTPQILFFLLPLGLIFVWLQIHYITCARELSRLYSMTEAPVLLHFSESITGAPTIRAYREEKRFLRENSERFDTFQCSYFHNIAAIEWLGLRLEMIAVVILSSSAAFLIFLPTSIMDSGKVGLSLSYGLALNAAMIKLVQYASNAEIKMVSVERITQYSKVSNEAPDIVPGRRPNSNWPQAGKIEIQNLEIRYRAESPLVLKGFSCTIFPGEKVGVVGRTGSGKSTLVQALFRLIEPSAGQICIDGVDISMIGLTDLRSKLSVIPQEPILFEGTLRSNLDPFNIHSDQQIWKALQTCQMMEAIQDKAAGLNSPVAEQGENWSVGQRQLLCLACVLLKKSRILVLDEATASVDISTDAIIKQAIHQEFNDSTVISIAHRIPTVIDSDRVLVLREGRLIENDKPERLLADRHSIFRELVDEYKCRSTSTFGQA